MDNTRMSQMDFTCLLVVGLLTVNVNINAAKDPAGLEAETHKTNKPDALAHDAKSAYLLNLL